MGLLCLGTVLMAIIVMVSLMTGPTLRRKMGEYNKALDAMAGEAEILRRVLGYDTKKGVRWSFISRTGGQTRRAP